MNIPATALIPPEKLTQYLLVPKPRNDKSGFLAQADFSEQNAELLEGAIRQLIVDNDAIMDREDEYGRFYQVAGNLHGPHDILPVITVWIEQSVDGEFRFVTLKPARR